MADTLVLCYHAVSERWPAGLSVRPSDFSDQLERLAGRGYRGIAFHEAVNDPPRGKRVAVTFDDAFRSVAELARPILDRLGWPATVFAVSNFASSGAPLLWPGIDEWVGTDYRGELAGLGWAELLELAGAGWEVGSHTRSHPRLTALDDAGLMDELATSRAECEAAMGQPCPSVAYPYGDVDARVASAAAAAGYTAAGALPARMHRPDPMTWPRVGIYYPDDIRRFQIKTSRLVRGARALLRV